MRNLLLLALLMGCSSDPKDTDTDTDTEETSETDTEVEVNTDCQDSDREDPDGAPVLRGRVVDEDGNAAGKSVTSVRYCNGDICISAQSLTCAGEYGLWGLPEGAGTLEAVPIGEDNTFATVLAIIPVDSSTSDRVIDMIVPERTHTEDLTETAVEHQVADGFWVTAAISELEPPSPLSPPPSIIGGVDATAIAPPMEGLPSGTAEAVYFLDPFDYHTTVPLPVRLTNSWGFADGEAELWLAPYAADWEKIGDLQLDGNGDLVLAAGGLEQMSTVVVVRK